MINPDAADSLAILITNLDAGRLAALRDVMVSIEGIPPAHVDIFDGLFSDAGFDARALSIISKRDEADAVDEIDTMALAGVSAMVAGLHSPSPSPLPPVETPEQITAEVKKLAESAASGPPQFSPPVATPTWGDGGKSIPDDLDTPLAAMVEPESNDIPDELLAVMQANPDEGPTEYRGRLQNLLHRFGIEDGKHFPGGGEALSADEKILIGRLLQVGAKSKQWAGL